MKSKFVEICLRALLIVLAASLAGIMFNILSPQGISLFHGQSYNRASAGAWKEVSLEQAQALLGWAIFVDARTKISFQTCHIKGAVNLPVYEFDTQWKNFTNAVPPEMELVIYCGGGDCGQSRELAGRLAQAGYGNIRVFTKGFYAWMIRGLPTATGAE